MVGIIAAGAYVPRLRLQRQAAAAHAWFKPGLRGLGKGERAMANWDEDVVTMAVEAARDCLAHLERARVSRVVLASTSHPNADRQNAGIVKEALNLLDQVGAMDVGGSRRAATTALLDALHAARGGAGRVLCLASEKRRAQPAPELELTTGDAAAAFLVGDGQVAAEFLGGHSVSIDFMDHFRAADREFDCNWESRWVRHEGYAKIAPQAVQAALSEVGLKAAEVDRFIMGAPMKGVNDAVAEACGVLPEKVMEPFAQALGDAGTAEPLILLAYALESARGGEILVVVGFGQGCDVLVFRAMGERDISGLGVSAWLARRRPESNYVKYLALNDHLDIERGMRAEFDQKVALTAPYRSRKAAMPLVGGRRPTTGAVQDVLDGVCDADGEIPCQIDGGLKCFGHPIGASELRMIYENYPQLLGRAGKRQRKARPRLRCRTTSAACRTRTSAPWRSSACRAPDGRDTSPVPGDVPPVQTGSRNRVLADFGGLGLYSVTVPDECGGLRLTGPAAFRCPLSFKPRRRIPRLRLGRDRGARARVALRIYPGPHKSTADHRAR